MLINTLEDCCNFALAALDGIYGWVSEIVAIIIFVFIFNFLTRSILKRLHRRFEKQKKVWKDGFVVAIYKPLSYYVWFFAAVQTIDLIASRIYLEFPIQNRHVILEVGAILAAAWFLLRWKKQIVRQMVMRSKNREINIDHGKIDAIDKVATTAIIFFVVLFLLEVTDRSVNTLIAFGGVGGLAVAFASQEIIANFFGGFMIYFTQPFTIGDWISLPNHSIEGIVEEIGWYMTRVRSQDKRPIYIPNSIFTKLIVITPSRMSHRQIKETINLRSEDLSKIKLVTSEIHEMLSNHQKIDHQQPILASLGGFGNCSVDLDVVAYTQIIDNYKYVEIKEDILFKIAGIIEKHGAEFSTPTQILHLINDN